MSKAQRCSLSPTASEISIPFAPIIVNFSKFSLYETPLHGTIGEHRLHNRQAKKGKIWRTGGHKVESKLLVEDSEDDDELHFATTKPKKSPQAPMTARLTDL